MSTTEYTEQILSEILSIDKDNLFLNYIVKRLRDNKYRGWHISQHNRYDMGDIEIILRNIQKVAGTDSFAIPPGDYDRSTPLTGDFQNFQTIVNGVNAEMGRGTINSLKKNFFPDLDEMDFLIREKIKPRNTSQPILYGKLTPVAIEFIEASTLIEKYKKFTDGIDKLFGSKISELAEMIHLSDYINDTISIYEFMFIFSDNAEYLDKIGLLDSYRSLKKHERAKVIELIKKYAEPDNFEGDKTAQRDFHNWKNQAQQIMGLLKTTVYFEVDQNKFFRLNVGTTGFFQEPTKRSIIPKREYFTFHNVRKRDKFELHHIIPISSARNKEEAKMVDNHINLIYIHRGRHKRISQNGDKNVVLTIDPNEAIFSDFENKDIVKTENEKDALYTKNTSKIEKITEYNTGLLKSIFNFEKPQ